MVSPHRFSSRIEQVICTLVFLLLGFWGVFESLYGVLQMLHIISSRSPLFILTGSFSNPGPYGGFIAIISAIMLSYLVKYRWDYKQSIVAVFFYGFAFMVLCLCIIVLPATMSRSAWLGLSISIIVLMARQESVVSFFRPRVFLIVSASIVLIILFMAVFFMKKESALGRFHIWDIETRAILHHPITGTGLDSFLYTYGNEQASFFQEKQRSQLRIKIAGCPEYPFNEYLGIGVERGVVAAIMTAFIIILSIVRLYRIESIFASGMIVWAVFAFFSYPLSTWQLRLVLISLLTISWMPKCWSSFERLEIIKLFVASFITLVIIIPTGKHNHKNKERTHELFVEGQSLFQNGEYRESLLKFLDGSKKSCDPMFHVMMGRDYEAIGLYKDAEKEYWQAHYMVPARIYPRFRLMELYIKTGQNTRAISLAQDIVYLDINDSHPIMRGLQDAAQTTLDSLLSVSKVNNEQNNGEDPLIL